jgi:hypothetical protein
VREQEVSNELDLSASADGTAAEDIENTIEENNEKESLMR